MADVACDACGEPNSPDSQFCSACQAFLAWEGRPADVPADATMRLDPRVAAAVMQQLSRDAAGSAQPATQRPPGPPRQAPPREGGPPPLSGPIQRPAQQPFPSGIQQQHAQPQAQDVGYRLIQPADRPVPPPAAPTAPPSDSLAVTVTPTAVELLPTGDPAALTVHVTNRSDIVDGYVADIPSRPPWLHVIAGEVRLLPGSEEDVAVAVSLAPGVLIPAQQIRVSVRVRSTSHPAIELSELVTVTVPVVDGTLLVKLEPQVVRAKEVAIGAATVTVENRGSNRPVRVTLAGTDPELAIGFAFAPPVLDLPPSGSASAQLHLRAPAAEPGATVSRTFSITVRDGARSVDTTGTFVQESAEVIVDPPAELRLEPSVVRGRDTPLAEMMLIADNRRGRHPVQLQLAGRDPERLVAFLFQPPVLVVPAGATAAARVHLQAPPPEPGGEVTRSLSIVASDGDPAHRLEATGQFVQNSSALVVDPPVGLRLDPEVIRIEGFGNGQTTVAIDNRGGRNPARIALTGFDPERVLRWEFTPPVVDVPPGGWAYARATVGSPRPEGGQQVTRPFTVVASDHDSSVERSGTVVHTAGDPRPWIRVALVVLGAVLMMAGVFTQWLRGGSPELDLTGAQWTAQRFIAYTTLNSEVTFEPGRPIPEFLTSAGLVITILAVLMLFGLTGTSGRLTRFAALLAVLAVAAFVIAFALLRQPEVVGSGAPSVGIFLIVVGAVVGFFGSLVRRR